MSVPSILTAISATVAAVVWPVGHDQAGTAIFKGVETGSGLAVPNTPWAMIQLAPFTQPDQLGPQREITDWSFTLRALLQHAPDAYAAESVLADLIEPLRAAFRAGIKLGLANVERALIKGGNPGYVEINGVWYRFIDLTIAVREKVTVEYSA